MKISVVVPTYNRAIFLPRTLDSLLAQERVPDEIIVVDDGSTDDTSEVVYPYLNRIRYERQANGGVATARNTGMHLALGEALLFLDSDDKLCPTALQQLEAALTANPGAALAFCQAQMIDTADQVIAPLWNVDDDAVDMWTHLIQANCLRSPGAVLIDRQHLEKVAPWDQSVAPSEDWDLWLLLAESGAPFVRVADPLFLYRVHASNTSLNQNLMRKTGLAMYRKHLVRNKDNPQRFDALVKQYYTALTYQSTLDNSPGDISPAFEDTVESTPVVSNRHAQFRRVLVGSGAAKVYRRIPIRLRHRLRSLLGVSPETESNSPRVNPS